MNRHIIELLIRLLNEYEEKLYALTLRDVEDLQGRLDVDLKDPVVLKEALEDLLA